MNGWLLVIQKIKMVYKYQIVMKFWKLKILKLYFYVSWLIALSQRNESIVVTLLNFVHDNVANFAIPSFTYINHFALVH